MKRSPITWALADADGVTIATGTRYARRTAREAAEKALGDHCRQLGIYANRTGHYAWVGTDGRAFTVTLEPAP